MKKQLQDRRSRCTDQSVGQHGRGGRDEDVATCVVGVVIRLDKKKQLYECDLLR